MATAPSSKERPIPPAISLARSTSADFNGDGNIDLAVANQRDNTLSILFGNGDGTFQAQLLYPAGILPQGVAVGDFNCEVPDLAIGNNGMATKPEI